MQLTAKPSLPNALLISISTPQFKGDEATESLAELARLVTTLGFKVVGLAFVSECVEGLGFRV